MKVGWYCVDKEVSDKILSVKANKLYITKNGSIIHAGLRMHVHDYKGPERIEFGIHWTKDQEYNGHVVNYDKKLKHKSGNHFDRTPGWDIVGEYTGKMPGNCPHCGKIIGTPS